MEEGYFNMVNYHSDTDKLAESITPIVKKSIEKAKKVKDKLKEDAKSLAATKNLVALSKPPTNPDKSVNKTTTYGITFDQLRQFAVTYPIARACINHRLSQITQLSWAITPTKVILDEKEKKGASERCDLIKKKLHFPSGQRQMSFTGFLNKIVEDTLVIDAVAIEKKKTTGGDIIGWQPFDAATIELLLLEDGSIPQPPLPAYQQRINGRIINQLTTDDIYYGMMHPRTSSPYGLSPLESLVVTVTTALKLQSYNLGYLSEGNVPEGFVEIPKDIASSPEQLAAWQEAWDAIFSGDPRYTRKLKFLPEGMKYHETKKQSDMTFERFEKWLLLNCTSVFQVSPQDIGFTTDVNKAVADTQWEIGKERGMMPLAHFIKEIMDEIIQYDLDQEDLEFTWLNLNPTNALEEAKAFDILVRTGAVSIDEFRIGEGLEPIGVPHYIMTPIGPIFTKDLVEQSNAGFEPTLPYAMPAGKTPQPVDPNSPTAAVNAKESKPARSDTSNPETLRSQARDKSGMIDDLKKWKKAAKNDLKMGNEHRNFYTDTIDTRTKELIKMGLLKSKDTNDINALFDSFINSNSDQIDGLKDLYAKISDIVRS